MSTTELELDLWHLVAELAELDPDQAALDTPFAEAGIDSLLAMEVAAHVEHRFGIRLENDDLNGVSTVREFAALVDRRRTG